MTTHDHITDRLSDYIDHDLDASARVVVDQHLAACAACREVLSDLQAITSHAPKLPGSLPDRDLWDGVAARIGAQADGRVVPFAPKGARRFSFTLPQLAAAGIALMVMSGSLVYMAQSGNSRADFPAMSAETAVTNVAPVSLADPQYDNAIADLEDALEAGRSRLDPETVKVLEQNLSSIDKAIEQCRQALEADPANAFLNSHLVSARQHKLSLLRKATALTTGS